MIPLIIITTTTTEATTATIKIHGHQLKLPVSIKYFYCTLAILKVRYPTTVPTEAANNERLQQENINAVSDGAVVAISASAALLFICIIVAVYIFHRRRKNAE